MTSPSTILDRMLHVVPRSVRTAMRGRLRFQPFFERLYGIALVGMNYDEGFLLDISGELELLLRLHKTHTKNDPFVIFDVGANVGEYSRAALQVFGDGSKIHAFEPSPDAANRFQTNLGEVSNVSLHPVALSNTDGRAALISDWKGSPVASFHGESTNGHGSSYCDEVTVIRLDRFCAEHGINRIDLLKLDTEGHEHSILLGASALISSEAISGIQFEFGYTNTRSRVFFRDFYELLSPHYNLFRIVKDGLYPVRDPYLHEIFRTANYFARLKQLPPL